MNVWLEKLKLNKQLVKSVTEAGYLGPREIQSRTMSRILGGQDFVAIAPEGAGKTTAYVLGVLGRLKQGYEDAPRALILVPDRDRAEQVEGHFQLLNKNKSIKVVTAYPGPSLEAQMDEILDGADIVVATPDRARAIYLKLGLNLNKIMMFVVDDADLIVKQGLQLPVVELANSIRNCQHLIFTEVLHEKLEKMIAPFMKEPAVVEVEELAESSVETIPQLLYLVPNFKTKLNLLQLLAGDDEVFTKVVVFVNSRLTAEKIYQSLTPALRKETAVLKPMGFQTSGSNSIADFTDDPEIRLLIAANESDPGNEPYHVPFIIHFDLPENKETYIGRVIRSDAPAEGDDEMQEEETIALTFSTDIELSIVRKIEQVIGKKMELTTLPEDLVIAKDQSTARKENPVTQNAEETRGAAFHEKKASNAKNYNYSAGQKAKMTKKRKH